MTNPTNSTSADDPRVNAALKEYLERRDRGEEIDPETFLADHADVADALRSFVAADSEVRRAAGGTRSAPGKTQPLASQAATPDDTSVVNSRAAATSVELPPTFGRYKIVRTLGSGAMGTVYLAEDTQLQRPVALKTAIFDHDPSGELLERFYREARSAATLRHSHICPVYDVDQIEGRHFLTMAYIDGKPLSDYVKGGKPLTEKDALTLVRKLALALQEAHDHGIIHRDLKPGNIMVDSKGEPIITDFGLARRVGQTDQARITQSGMIIGSPAYMSPEQVDGEPDRLTGAADQYSLGVILFELLTGQIPFRGTVSSILGSILTKAPPKPSSLRPGLDPRVEALCLKMMAKRPEERFPNLKAAAAEAAAIQRTPAAGGNSPAATVAAPKPAARGADAAAKASGVAAGTASLAGKAARKTQVEEVLSAGSVTSLAATARKLLSRRDYDEAIRMLEQIPENRRSDEVRALLDKARALADEVMFLLTEIDEAVRRNDADTAIRKADALLKVKPGHHRAKEIQEQYGAYGEGGAARGLRRDRYGRAIVGEEGWNLWIALAFGLVVFGVALWGVTAYLKVGDAVVKVTINDPDITVSLKGHSLSITGAKEPIKVTPGEGTLKITYGELDFQSSTFTLKKGENPVVTIERLDDKLAAKFGDESLGEWKVPVKPKDGATATTAGAGAATGWHGWPADAPKPAVAPFDAARAKRHQEEWAAYLKVPVEYTNSIGMKFVLIPPGEFTMGGTKQEIEETLKIVGSDTHWQECLKGEAPQHKVILTQPIYLGATEVTQAQYEKVMGSNPSWFAKTGPEKLFVDRVAGLDTSTHPVESVSWHDAADFCAKLSQLENLPPAYVRSGERMKPRDGTGYRLPSDAEWEFACRAGTTSKFWIGDRDEDLVNAGWFATNSGNRTHPAGERKPNAFGLFDIHGNVNEWVQDGWDPESYEQFRDKAAIDPRTPPSAGSLHIFRGGSWLYASYTCRASNRHSVGPADRHGVFGFRVSLPVVVKQTPVAVPAAAGQGAAPVAAAAPFDAASAKTLQEAWAKHLGVPVERTNSIGMKLRLIPPGDYLIGATDAEITADLAKAKGDGVWEQRIRSSGPRHTVRLTKPYYLGVFEVTQKEFETVMGRNPSYLSPTGAGKALVQGRDTGSDPVEYLTWNDAADFCMKLSEREKLSLSYAGAGDSIRIVAGEGYRLPTEAEWEAACRAGTTTKYWFGDDEAATDQAAWTTRNAKNLVHPAGQLKANPFGLFDVHGNVWEWCHDLYNPNEYAAFAAQPAIDPTGPATAAPPHRVFRGGGMTFDPSKHTSAIRVANDPKAIDHTIGFRVLLPVTAKPAPPAAPAAPAPAAAGAAAPPAAIAPFDAAAAKASQEAWAKHLGVPVEHTNSLGMKFVLIPPGEYQRGTSDADIDRLIQEQPGYPRNAFNNEKPQHRVRITRPFYLGRFEVTVGEFRAFTSAAGFKTDAEKGRVNWGYDAATGVIAERADYSWKNPGFAQTDQHPVPNVSWNDGIEFDEWLSRKEGRTYRFPTEAEWEHACRAGTTTLFHTGDTYASLEGFANLADQSWKRTKGAPADAFYAPFDDGFAFTAPVGRFKPNAFGLHDMHGNVWEWCRDGYEPDHYGTLTGQVSVDPLLPEARRRVDRGASWVDGPVAQRSAMRNWASNRDQGANSCGFRVLLEIPATAPPAAPAGGATGQAGAAKAAPRAAPWLEALKREAIPPEALAAAGAGDAARAAPQLVAALGDTNPIHHDQVKCVAFSRDGRWLATGSFDKSILVWDVATGNVARVLRGHEGAVISVGFSGDGGTIASASQDGTIRLWPRDGAGEPEVLRPDLGVIWQMAVSPDGRFLAAGGMNRKIKVWTWGRWTEPAELPPVAGELALQPTGNRNAALAFSPDGKLLAVCAPEPRGEGTAVLAPIRLHKTDDWSVSKTLRGHEGGPWSDQQISFSRDGRSLVSHARAGDHRIWDVATGKLSESGFQEEDHGASALSPDGATLAVAGWGYVALYDRRSKERRQILRGGSHALWAVEYSPDGRTLVSGDDAGGVLFWDVDSHTQKFTERGHRHRVQAVAISRDGRRVVSAGHDFALRRWDLNRPGDGQIVTTFARCPQHLSISPDGSRCGVVASNAWFHIEERGVVDDVDTGKRLFALKPMVNIERLALGPDGRSIAGVDRDGTLLLWDARTGQETRRFPPPGPSFGDVAFSGDGKLVAAASADRKHVVKVWNAETGALAHEFDDPAPFAVALNSDGSTLATGRQDGTIHLWNLKAGGSMRTLRGPESLIRTLRFSQDGKTLAAAHDDGSVRVWNPETGQARDTITFPFPARSVPIDLDASGRYLIAGPGPQILILRLKD